ncbi:MAG TPA: hypothetical protein VGD40_16555 [Chryseosolibacter sp.]
MKHLAKYLAAVMLLAVGCGEDEFTPTDRGTDFYPLQVGSIWTYAVEETVYSEVAAPQNRSYQLRLTVSDSIKNAAGTYTYVVLRTKKNEGESIWTSLDTWSVRKDDREVIVTEGNTAFKKLMFPVREQLTWNGNEYNTLGEDEYVFHTVDLTEPINGMTFDHTIRVEQENNGDFIVFLDERDEVYAKGVGLVKRSLRQLNYCSTEDCIGQQKIKSGRVYAQVLLSYEK